MIERVTEREHKKRETHTYRADRRRWGTGDGREVNGAI